MTTFGYTFCMLKRDYNTHLYVYTHLLLSAMHHPLLRIYYIVRLRVYTYYIIICESMNEPTVTVPRGTALSSGDGAGASEVAGPSRRWRCTRRRISNRNEAGRALIDINKPPRSVESRTSTFLYVFVRSYSYIVMGPREVIPERSWAKDRSIAGSRKTIVTLCTCKKKCSFREHEKVQFSGTRKNVLNKKKNLTGVINS